MIRFDQSRSCFAALRARRVVDYALVVLLLSTMFACGEDSTAEAIQVAKLAETCSLNSDCSDPLVCAFERCHTECVKTRDCPRGSLCVASGKPDVFICQLEDEATCEQDDECPGKQRCAEDGVCRGGCSEDEDCPESQRCIESEVGLVCADPEDLDGDSLSVADPDTDDDTDDADEPTGSDDPSETDEEPSDDDGTDEPAAGSDAGSEPVAAEDQTTVVFTREGGSVEGLGVGFELPEGAVDDDTDVTIVRVDAAESLPGTWTPLGGVFAISGDLNLSVAVTVRIPYETSATGAPGLAYRPSTGGVWEIVDADFEEEQGYATAERTDVAGEYVVVSQQPEDEFDCSVCGETQICQFGRCYDQCDGTNPCGTGQQCCDGLCADTLSDPNNCGGCDVLCEGDDNSAVVCESGFCEVGSCSEPFDDCDGNSENGCEADLTSDQRHCGGCGVNCGVGAECIDGECERGLAAIYAGDRSTCVTRQNGKVLCWGGVASGGTTSYSPAVVSGLGPILDLKEASGRAYAVLATGRVVSFDASEWEAPTAEAVSDGIAVGTTGAGNTCVLRQSGLVSCWGNNSYGEAGIGVTGAVAEPTSVSGLNDAIHISLGQYHTCAIKQGGIPTCWGYNSYGLLGDGETGAASAPRPVIIAEGSSEAYQDFTDIAASSNHTCGLRATGVVLCWGYNGYKELGRDYEDLMTSPVPVEVEGLTDVVSIHSSPGASHTCALHGDGSVSCWGRDHYGQLGRATASSTGGLPDKVPGVEDAIALAVGTSHTCALPAEGSPRCWGYNGYGQLGDGSATQRESPVPVANLP